ARYACSRSAASSVSAARASSCATRSRRKRFAELETVRDQSRARSRVVKLERERRLPHDHRRKVCGKDAFARPFQHVLAQQRRARVVEERHEIEEPVAVADSVPVDEAGDLALDGEDVGRRVVPVHEVAGIVEFYTYGSLTPRKQVGSVLPKQWQVDVVV